MPLAYGLTESIDLTVPSLPQSLDRLRIAHLSDLHLYKRSRRLDALIYQLAKIRLDLGVLTGDYILRGFPQKQALPYLRELTQAVRPTLGWYGIFGNHDNPEIIEQLSELQVTWLIDEAVALQDRPIEIVGMRCGAGMVRPDPVSLAQSVAALPTVHADRGKRLRIALSHKPDFLPLASDLGADLMLSGHTHGGQIRLPFKIPLFNSSDLPLHLSAGLLRHRNTLGLVSRGLGSTGPMDSAIRVRILCPPHAPVYTLRTGSAPGEYTSEITSIWRW